MILFHLQSLGAERHRHHFLNFKKIFQKKFPHFSCFYAYFLMFCIFFTGNSVKQWKSVTYHEKRKTHQNIKILTMCKIYNINNNKTADILSFHHYIDEIIQ